MVTFLIAEITSSNTLTSCLTCNCQSLGTRFCRNRIINTFTLLIYVWRVYAVRHSIFTRYRQVCIDKLSLTTVRALLLLWQIWIRLRGLKLYVAQVELNRIEYLSRVKRHAFYYPD